MRTRLHRTIWPTAGDKEADPMGTPGGTHGDPMGTPGGPQGAPVVLREWTVHVFGAFKKTTCGISFWDLYILSALFSSGDL
jgi:hypothetical protein